MQEIILTIKYFERQLPKGLKKIKNHTHLKKVGQTSEFLFGIYLMNLKNNNLYKKLLTWANKKCKNFNIYNVVFF